MKDLDASVREGHYARKQLLCTSRLIAWSHHRRFAVGLDVARQLKGRRVLDYGCGDGTFLALLMGGAAPPVVAVGAETHASLVDDCRARLGARPGLGFVLIPDLETAKHEGAYDVVVCMEVLEHVIDAEPVVDRLARVLDMSGTLIVSVPVETGFPLIVKQAVRRVAGWRGIGDYPGTSPYTFAEYRTSIFAGPRQHIVRPIHAAADGTRFHDHKGFNWMVLRAALERRFRITRTLCSPIRWLPPQLATQVWFVAVKTR